MPALAYDDVGAAINQIITEYSLRNGHKSRPIIRACFGDIIDPVNEVESMGQIFTNVDSEVWGQKFQVDLQAPVTGYARSTDRASRMAARTPDTSQREAQAFFELTHFPIGEDVDLKTVKQVVAEARQGKSDKLEMEGFRILKRIEKTLGDGMLSSATTGDGDLHSGGLLYGIDDANIYGGVDRSHASGELFQSHVLDLAVADSSTLGLEHLDRLAAYVDEDGGFIEFWLTDVDTWAAISTLLNDKGITAGAGASADGKTLNIGFRYIEYQGAKICHDPGMPAGTMIGITPKGIKVKADFPRLGENSFNWTRNQGLEASFLFQDDIFLSAIVETPPWQAKILNIVNVA